VGEHREKQFCVQEKNGSSQEGQEKLLKRELAFSLVPGDLDACLHSERIVQKRPWPDKKALSHPRSGAGLAIGGRTTVGAPRPEKTGSERR